MRAATLIDKVAVALVLPVVPVIVTVVGVETPTVVAVKVAVVPPAAIVTDAGTVVLGSLDVRLTVMPPVGAGPVRVTVPDELAPPRSVVGERTTLWMTEAFTVTVVVTVTDPNLAVIVAVIGADSAGVVTLKFTELEPAGMTTEAGITTLDELEVSVTVEVERAGPVRAAVPVAALPP